MCYRAKEGHGTWEILCLVNLEVFSHSFIKFFYFKKWKSMKIIFLKLLQYTMTQHINAQKLNLFDLKFYFLLIVWLQFNLLRFFYVYTKLITSFHNFFYIFRYAKQLRTIYRQDIVFLKFLTNVSNIFSIIFVPIMPFVSRKFEAFVLLFF